ncbi:hypothetical protein D9M68_459050 [compost metagenome]
MAPLAAFELAHGGQDQAGAGCAERVADGDGAAIGIEPWIIECDTELPGAAEHLGGEGLVDLDQVHVVQAQARPLQCLGAGRHRPQAHEPWLDTRHRPREDARAWLEAMAFADGPGADQQSRRAVIHARRIAGGNHAVGEQRPEPGQAVGAGFRARMLITLHQQRRLLAPLRHLDGQQLPGEETRLLRLAVQGLAARGEGIRLLAADGQFTGDVVGRLRHGVRAEGHLHPRVGEACANGAVEDPEVAGPGAFRLGHDKGRAAHAFRAAGNEQLALAAPDRACRIQHRRQPRAAQAVEGQAADCHGKPGEQRSMAGQVAAIFARLAGAAGDQVFVGLGGEGIARHQGTHHRRQQVIRADSRQGAGMAAEGRAQAVIDVGRHTPSSGAVSGRPSCTRRRSQGLRR